MIVTKNCVTERVGLRSFGRKVVLSREIILRAENRKRRPKSEMMWNGEPQKKGGGIKPNINMHFGRCADLKAEKTRIWNDESLKEALSCVLTRLIIKPSIVLFPLTRPSLLPYSSPTLPRPQHSKYIMFDEECCLQCGKPMRHDK